MMKRPLIVLLLALLYYMPVTLTAQCSMGGTLFTFTNVKGDSLWSQADNWDQMEVPGSNDCVLIETPYTVIFDEVSAIISEMTVNGGGLIVNPGTSLSIFDGKFNQSETTIESTGEISFTNITGTDWQLINNGKLHSVFPLHTDHTLSFLGNSTLVNNDSITGLPNMLWSGSLFTNAAEAFVHAQIESHKDVVNIGTIKGARSIDIQRGLFENQGHISVGGFTSGGGPLISIGGCPNCTELSNKGTISISNVHSGGPSEPDNVGIFVGLGKLVNENDIVIQNLTHDSQFKTVGIHLSRVAEFINNGNIDIHDIKGPGIRSSTMNATNHDFISMNNVGRGPLAAIYLVQDFIDPGQFMNNGYILLQKAYDGIYTDSDQEFINTGTVRILDHTEVAIKSDPVLIPYIKYHEEGKFTNQASGLLEVLDFTQQTGQKTIDTWFENYGSVEIIKPNMSTIAIRGVFLNYGSTLANVSPTNSKSFRAKVLNYSNGRILTNSVIEIDTFNQNTLPKPFNEGSMITSQFFKALDDFENKGCGYMEFSQALSSVTTSITNNGVMRLGNCCIITDEPVFLENNGILVDTFGILISEPGFINNGVHIDTDPGMYSCGNILTQITQGPGLAP